MKAVVLQSPGIDNVALVDLPDPEPGPGEVRVRVKAVSLNYRDLLTLDAGYGSRQKTDNLILLSDGAGTIDALGDALGDALDDGVAGFQVGDRVVASFFRDWVAGPATRARLDSALGGAIDGMFAELRVLPSHSLVKVPDALSDVEAAALPCAAVTAWSALVSQGGVAPGDVVLTQGTGGVSVFALQFAKMAGATVIATSSSDEKLARARDLGADHGINYKEIPDWARQARALNNGNGVDHVVEVGGAGTLEQSIKATRVGGTVSLIGVLSGAKNDLRLPLVVTQNMRLQGVTVGSRDQLTAVVGAMAAGGVRPVIDQVFGMTDFRRAFDHMQSGRHFGKICLDVGSS
jgi:NADPH:quinone reductase-like Zn-dependent oxidoreductase